MTISTELISSASNMPAKKDMTCIVLPRLSKNKKTKKERKKEASIDIYFCSQTEPSLLREPCSQHDTTNNISKYVSLFLIKAINHQFKFHLLQLFNNV